MGRHTSHGDSFRSDFRLEVQLCLSFGPSNEVPDQESEECHRQHKARKYVGEFVSTISAVEVKRVFKAHRRIAQSEWCFAVLTDMRHNNCILKVVDVVASDDDRVVSQDSLHSNQVSKSLISRVKFSAEIPSSTSLMLPQLPLRLFSLPIHVLFLSFKLA